MRGINPRALTVMDLLDGKLNDLGGLDSISVTLTEDMVREEQIMALIERYLKAGDSLAAAHIKPIAFRLFWNHSSSSVIAIYFATLHLGRNVRLNSSFLNNADRCCYRNFNAVSFELHPC